MYAMKKEMLPILARLSQLREWADGLNRAITELEAACRGFDGSEANVD
jgi:hypothetical protein